MTQVSMADLVDGLKSGDIVPYLGAGILESVTNLDSGEPLPASSDNLIIAMNGGKPMAPRLMYEFPRAAMDLELKKGRSYVSRFLNELYSEKKWSRAPLHDFLAQIKPQYVVDTNRDTQLQETYSSTPHNLIVGVARIGGTDYRFKLYYYDGECYTQIQPEEVNSELPTLFKPMGTPVPEPNYIASDADYVDYITELMGGFAIPKFLKEYRKNKQYLFLGLRMTRDTERMVLSDIIYAAKEPKGWALIPDPSAKEERFCRKMGIEVIKADVTDLIPTSTAACTEEIKEAVSQVGC